MNPRVFIFLDTMPKDQGSGARLRLFSNIQAFLDLKYSVEVIYISNKIEEIPENEELNGVVWTKISPSVLEKPNLFSRLSFRYGFVNRHSIKYVFPFSKAVFDKALELYKKHPEAIYLFDGESQSCVIPWMPKAMRSVWGEHDLPSQISKATVKISCDAESRQPTKAEERDINFMCRLERLIARASKLVLCIGTEDEKIIKNDFGCPHAGYLPMSIPVRDRPTKNTTDHQKDKIRLLHLGAIQHLPSYRSLEYLFAEIYPKLPPELVDKIKLYIVGNIVDGIRSRRIKELAKPFQGVTFTGYVEDISPYYEQSDLQIVASTDSVGIRTRIIESFANCLPVLSTTIGANGIKGIINEENILIADSPSEFVNALYDIVKKPEKLQTISQNAKELYMRENRRPVVASTLSKLLENYI